MFICKLSQQKRKNVLFSLLTVIIIIGLWFIITGLNLVSPTMIPSPFDVWDAFVEIIENGYKGTSLCGHIGASLGRLLIAFGLAVVTAIPLGLLSGRSSTVRAALDPIIQFYRPLPPLAYYTLLVLWMGIGDEPKIMLLYLAAFPPMYLAAVTAVPRVRQEYILSSQTLGASKWQTFYTIIFPACLPELFTGIRSAMGVSYTTLVAAEMVAGVSGIGWMVLQASNYLRSDIIFLGIIIMGVTGIVLDCIILLIQKKVAPWEGKD